MSLHQNARPLQGAAHDNLQAGYNAIPVDVESTVSLEKDQTRPIDRKKVAELKESFQTMGCLVPIGIRSSFKGEEYKLARVVYGHHRFIAMQELWQGALADLRKAEADDGDVKAAEAQVGRWSTIQALKYPHDIKDEWAELAALTENVVRSELTSAERKAQAASINRLIQKADNRSSPGRTSPVSAGAGRPKRKHPKTWAKPWYENAKLPKQTFHDWWKEYREATGVEHTPSEASVEEIDGFINWCDGKRGDMESVQANNAQKWADRDKLTDDMRLIAERWGEDGPDLVKEAVRGWWPHGNVDFRTKRK